MKVKEITTFLYDVEKKFPVDEWKIDDVSVWPIIRMDLYNSLYYEDDNKRKKVINFNFKLQEIRKIIVGSLRYIYALFLDYKKNGVIAKTDVLFLADGVSRVKLGEDWYDKFCDPLIDIFKKYKIKTLTLEPLHIYLTPRYRSSVFIQPFLDYLVIKNVLFKSKIENIVFPQHDKFVLYLQSRNLSIPVPTIERTLQIYTVVNSHATYFAKVIKKTKPSLAFLVSYYGPIGMGFVLACNRLGVKCVDIQHGVQGEYHPAYGSWNRVPKSGYNLLPSFFLCWSKHEVNVIKKWTRGKKYLPRPLHGGNLFLKQWLETENDLVRNHDTIVKHIKKRMPATAHILFTLSPSYSTFEYLENIIKVMKKTEGNWQWWVRLHPCMLSQKSEIKKIFLEKNLSRLIIDEATDLPLYALLRHIDLHITHESSVIIEAAAFSVPSVFTSENAKDIYKEQIALRQALFAKSVSEIYTTSQLFLKQTSSKAKKKTGTSVKDIMIIFSKEGVINGKIKKFVHLY